MGQEGSIGSFLVGQQESICSNLLGQGSICSILVGQGSIGSILKGQQRCIGSFLVGSRSL